MEVQRESLMGGENTYDGRGKGLREKFPDERRNDEKSRWEKKGVEKTSPMREMSPKEGEGWMGKRLRNDCGRETFSRN